MAAKLAALRMLAVDDDSLWLEIVQQMVGLFGHECRTCRNGAAAWNQISESQIDVLIIDRQMPIMDGLELCMRVRAVARPAYVYVVLVTGLQTPEGAVQPGGRVHDAAVWRHWAWARHLFTADRGNGWEADDRQRAWNTQHIQLPRSAGTWNIRSCNARSRRGRYQRRAPRSNRASHPQRICCWWKTTPSIRW